MQKVLFFLILVFPFFTSAIAAESSQDVFGDDYLINQDFKEKKWKEGKTTIPPFPENKNLIEIKMYHAQRKFYIDKNSILPNKRSYIARYTVVIESTSGVRTVFHEGIRCDTKQYKVFAYGNINKKTFSPARKSKWKDITETLGPFRYRSDLLRYFMCKRNIIRFKVKEIVRTLKYPPQLHEPSFFD